MSLHPPGVRDPFGRETTNLRISLNRVCNVGCFFCHMEGQPPNQYDLTAEELERVVRTAVRLGVRKVKLSGGEPTLRRDIKEIVTRLRPHLEELSMTTNGSLLSKLARPLRQAGLDRINLSLHTLKRDTYKAITGVDLLPRVLEGLNAALEAGFSAVKINMVLLKGVNESEVWDLMDFAAEKGAILQVIELQGPLHELDAPSFWERYVPVKPLEDELRRQGVLVGKNELHDRPQYRVPANGSSLVVELVGPMFNPSFCDGCYRIRLTADGRVKTCLFDERAEVNLKAAMTTGASDEELVTLLVKAIHSREPYWREEA
ncbi:MAG: GTP 3',8-cyclase MoaA [Thermoplasmata archaeon]